MWVGHRFDGTETAAWLFDVDSLPNAATTIRKVEEGKCLFSCGNIEISRANMYVCFAMNCAQCRRWMVHIARRVRLLLVQRNAHKTYVTFDSSKRSADG